MSTGFVDPPSVDPPGGRGAVQAGGGAENQRVRPETRRHSASSSQEDG